MGLPIWKPKNEQQQQHQKLPSPPSLPKQQQHASSSPHPSHAHYRLYRRGRSTTSNSPYYIANGHHHQRMLHPLTTEPTEQLQYDHQFPPSRSHAAEEQNDDQQMEQRLNEKQELLDQLIITTSLLDQFLSIRDVSNQENLALPPFVADDLLAILTATSATLTSTSIPSNNMGLIRSYDRVPPSSSSSSTNNSATLSRSMTNTTSSRLADLESSIVSAHHRVSDRLNQLGAILPPSTTRR